MEVRQYLGVLWRWRWLIVSATLIAAAVSYAVAMQLPRVYASSTTVMVGALLQSANPQQSDFATGQQLAETYSQFVRREPVLRATVESLHLDMSWRSLAAQVSAGAVPQTQLLQITVLDITPERAKVIADELARQIVLQSPTPAEKQEVQQREFVDKQLADLQRRITAAQQQIDSLEARLLLESTASSIQDAQDQIAGLQQKVATWQSTYASLLSNKTGNINKLSILEPATLSDVPISPNVPLNVLVAAALGCALAIVGVLVVEYLDDRVKTGDEVTRILKLPCLGAIERHTRHPLPALSDPRSPAAEAYRVLRANVRFASEANTTSVLLVTSAEGGDGKSTTACNLAISIAQAGKRVILCDADLRRPATARLFGLPNEVGLSDLLRGRAVSIQRALRHTAVQTLRVLPSGQLPPNPAEQLDSAAMRERIAELTDLADIVVVDGPALLPLADARLLAGLCTGILLVVDARRTRRQTALQGKAILEHTGARVLGVVLQRARTGNEAAQKYYRAKPPTTASAIAEGQHENPAPHASGAIPT
jgi:capsular exopolysaccharide synthesis family protein